MTEPLPQDPSDYALLLAWRGGDLAAGDELVSRHFDQVYRFFFRKLDGAVEDLVQNTFLRCLELADRFREDASFGAYTMGVARWILMEHFRQIGREDPRVAETWTDESRETSPSDFVALRQGERRMLHALRKLPLDFQIAVELHYWEDMPLADIAEVLRISVGTVKSRIHRAKRQLARHLAELEDSGTGVAAPAGTPVDEDPDGDIDHWMHQMRRAAEGPGRR